MNLIWKQYYGVSGVKIALDRLTSKDTEGSVTGIWNAILSWVTIGRAKRWRLGKAIYQCRVHAASEQRII